MFKYNKELIYKIIIWVLNVLNKFCEQNAYKWLKIDKSFEKSRQFHLYA